MRILSIRVQKKPCAWQALHAYTKHMQVTATTRFLSTAFLRCTFTREQKKYYYQFNNRLKPRGRGMRRRAGREMGGKGQVGYGRKEGR